MFFLWIWWPKYSQAAARCLLCILGIAPTSNAVRVDHNDIKDKFLFAQFDARTS